MRALTILSVAYPLAPVSPDAVGGAEQVLGHLDRALVEAGHRSIVVAREDSRVRGRLVPVPAELGPLDDAAHARAQGGTRRAVAAALKRWPEIDLVHLHGIDFPATMPPAGVPALATLHLPPSWYEASGLRPSRPDTWLHCVSASQHADCPASPALLPPIPNGVPIEALGAARHARRGFALMLGRVCPEKGVHHALDAARLADMPLLIGGEVFGYEAHRRYFEEEVRPRLDARRRFLGPLSFARKRRLLSAARCLLAPSLVPETSSLVAMEAAACGTPVVAYPNGALAEIVEPGRTGFLVRDVAEMARAMREAGAIDAETCRAAARARFSLGGMVERYLRVYETLSGHRGRAVLGAA